MSVGQSERDVTLSVLLQTAVLYRTALRGTTFLPGGLEERFRSTLHRWNWDGNSLDFRSNSRRNGVYFSFSTYQHFYLNLIGIQGCFFFFIIKCLNYRLQGMGKRRRDSRKQRSGINMILATWHAVRCGYFHLNALSYLGITKHNHFFFKYAIGKWM